MRLILFLLEGDMKITRRKKTIFIKATSSEEFDRMLNESLIGLVDADVQIYGLYEGAILCTEIVVEDDRKTIADMFEEAGCGKTCGDCPFYERPKDGRFKYTVCGKRKISEGSRACDDYYLGRRTNAKAG